MFFSWKQKEKWKYESWRYNLEMYVAQVTSTILICLSWTLIFFGDRVTFTVSLLSHNIHLYLVFFGWLTHVPNMHAYLHVMSRHPLASQKPSKQRTCQLSQIGSFSSSRIVDKIWNKCQSDGFDLIVLKEKRYYTLAEKIRNRIGARYRQYFLWKHSFLINMAYFMYLYVNVNSCTLVCPPHSFHNVLIVFTTCMSIACRHQSEYDWVAWKISLQKFI